MIRYDETRAILRDAAHRGILSYEDFGSHFIVQVPHLESGIDRSSVELIEGPRLKILGCTTPLLVVAWGFWGANHWYSLSERPSITSVEWTTYLGKARPVLRGALRKADKTLVCSSTVEGLNHETNRADGLIYR